MATLSIEIGNKQTALLKATVDIIAPTLFRERPAFSPL
jgi:hypothetical protein